MEVCIFAVTKKLCMAIIRRTDTVVYPLAGNVMCFIVSDELESLFDLLVFG